MATINTKQTTTAKLKGRFLSANGKRVKVSIAKGPWIKGVNPDLIKLRPVTSNFFPPEILAALEVENNSDSMTDYFEADCIRLLPGHPLYDAAKEA